MNEHTIKAIEMLADKLHVPVEYLVEHFARLAPWEFGNVGVSAGITIMGVVLSIVARARRARERDKDAEKQDTDVVIQCTIVSGLGIMMAMFAMIGVLIETSQALKAVASPEAFAIKEILHLIR